MTSNYQKNIEEIIYYSNPIRQTSSKSKSTRNIRNNLKFTPFTQIELNTKYHFDYFETELKESSKEKKKLKKFLLKKSQKIMQKKKMKPKELKIYHQ